MNFFDAGDDDPGAAKCLKFEHGPRDPLDGAEVLFNDIVQKLQLANRDDKAPFGVESDYGRLVATARVDGDFFGHVV